MRSHAFVLAVISLWSCARPAPPPDELRIVQTQDFPNLNPTFVSGFGGQELAALLYSYLVKLDDRGRLVPDVATEVPTLENGGISADGRTIVYHLRPRVRFSDGRPLTAADVAATIAWVETAGSGVPSRIGFDDVSAARAIGPLTLRVELRRRFAPIVLYLCGPGNAIPILPKDGLGRSQVGSGPYVVEHWIRSDRLELRANDKYFRGRPAIAHLTIRFEPSSETAFEALASGEADAYVNADDAQYRPLRALGRLNVDRIPIDGTGGLFFNVQDTILSDARVRRGLASAIDAKAIVAKTSHGSERAQTPGLGLFEWAYDPRAFAMPRYDPRAAAALLDSAGWVPNRAGIRSRNGRPLALDLIVRSDKPSATSMATQIQAAEKLLGVTVTIRRFPVTAFVAPDGPLYSGHYQIALFQFIAGYDPDVSDQFACARIPPNGFNKARYCNPALDALAARASQTYDRRSRVQTYRAIERILARDLPLDALYQAVSINAFPKALRGQTTAVDTPFWNVAAWRF